MTYRIYHIRNTMTGNPGYVGFTSTDIHKRLRGHRHSAKSGSNGLLHEAMRQHGLHEFSITEVYTTKDKAHALKMEEHFIRELGTHHSMGGYNKNWGGQDGNGDLQRGRRNSPLTEFKKGHCGYERDYTSPRYRALRTKINLEHGLRPPSRKGTMWITNGMESKQIPTGDIPVGWRRGRVLKVA